MVTSLGQQGATPTSLGLAEGTPETQGTPTLGAGTTIHASIPSVAPTPTTTIPGMSPTGVPTAGRHPLPWSPASLSPRRGCAGVMVLHPVTPRTFLPAGGLPASLMGFTVAAWAQTPTDRCMRGCLGLQATCLLVSVLWKFFLMQVFLDAVDYCPYTVTCHSTGHLVSNFKVCSQMCMTFTAGMLCFWKEVCLDL